MVYEQIFRDSLFITHCRLIHQKVNQTSLSVFNVSSPINHLQQKKILNQKTR